MIGTTPALSGPCPACRQIRHDLCAGLARGCTCFQCQGTRIVAEATAAWARWETSAAALRLHLGRVLAADSQRRKRTRARLVNVRSGWCTECGAAFTYPRAGRARLTCSPACRQRKYARRKAARERAERMAA